VRHRGLRGIRSRLGSSVVVGEAAQLLCGVVGIVAALFLGCFYKQIRLSLLATPLGMPRKPQPLTGRAARCAPHPAHSLPSVARRVAVLTSQGVPLSGCPFQSRPGVVAGASIVAVGRLPTFAGCPACGAGRSARASNACEGGRWRAATVLSRRAPAEAGEGRGLRLLCVLSQLRLLSRPWWTERASGRGLSGRLRCWQAQQRLHL